MCLNVVVRVGLRVISELGTQHVTEMARDQVSAPFLGSPTVVQLPIQTRMFPRFLRPIQPSSRRAYSLFSKPPGGRFFNSSKPPKVVPPASAKSATRVEAATANNDTQQQAQQQQSTSSHLPDDPSASPSSAAPSQQSSSQAPPLPSLSSAPTALASHPLLSAPDLRLHQFFALHRPLVLSQPPTALFDTPPTLALGPAPPRASTPGAASQATLDDPPETTPEADADTARLLARTQAMNAVGSAVSWEATLRRLGLKPSEEDVAALEGLAVELDSTKRKRRKKMKKHKYVNLVQFYFRHPDRRIHHRLTKRRRVRRLLTIYFTSIVLSNSLSQLQRAQRLKMGR
jgi:Mitochondrial domain of unknown function (DUF1713)